MIHLNVGFFKPMLIFLSVILLPITIALFVLCIFDFRIGLFVVAVIMFAIYILSILGAYKFSKNKDFYLKTNENGCIEIEYPNIIDDKLHLDIMTNAIIKIEYYKISSIKAWCMLYNSVLPQCAYITYIYEGKEICKHIGYPDYKEIDEFCADSGIEFIIK